MSDGQLDIEFKLNTSEAKRDAEEIRKGVKSVNDTLQDGTKPLKEQETLAQRLRRRMAELQAEAAKTKASLSAAENAGTAVGDAFDKSAQKITSDVNAADTQIAKLQSRIKSIQSDLAKWTDPKRSTLGLTIDNPYFDKYKAQIIDLQNEIKRLQDMPLTLDQGSQSATSLNGLKDTISQLVNQLPAFSDGLDAGLESMLSNLPELADQLINVSEGSKEMEDSGEDATSVLESLADATFSWQTLISVGVSLLSVYSKEIIAWVIEMTRGKVAIDEMKIKIQDLNKALEGSEYRSAIKNLNELRINIGLVSEGKLKQNEVLKQYNETIGKVTGKVTDLGIAEKELARNADAYVKMTLYKAAANLALEEAAKSALEVEKTKLKELAEFEKTNDKRTNRGSFSTSGYVSNYEINRVKKEAEEKAKVRKQAEIDANLEVQKAQEKIAKDFQTKAAEIATTNKFNFFDVEDPKKPKDNKSQELLNSRKNVLDKLSDLDKEYARKSMVSDQQEIQVLKDKFSEFRRIIEDENNKIRKYNQKNKTNIGLIDIDQVDPIEERATADLLYAQQTKRIAAELDKQKQLFADYEDYKEKLGIEKANEAFKSRLKGFERYNQYLQSVAQKETEAFAAVGNKTATAGQDERVKLLEKEQKEQKDKETKKQTELLALMITYDQKRKELIRKFEEDRAALVTAATAEELAEFDRKHIEQLNNLDDSHIQQLAAYKALFSGIEKLSDAAARKVIADAKAMLKANVNISGDERKKIEGAINDAATSLDKRLPDRVAKLSNEFADMASNIGRVDEGLGSMLKSVSDVLRATVQVNSGIDGLTKGIANYNKTKNDPASTLLDKVSGIAGIAGPVGQIVGAVGSVVSGVIGFFNAASESARQAKEQMRKYKEEILAGELEYSRLLRERARDQGAINDMTLKELEIQKELLATQLKAQQLREVTYNKENASFIDKMLGNDKVTAKEMLSDYEYALKRIQNEGLQVTGQKTEKYGGFLGIGKKTRVVDITASLAGKTYEDLEKLYTEGKMTESTKAMFEALQKAKKEVDDINELMKEIDETIMDKMSGSVSANSISSSIIKGLKEGKRAVVDFAGDVEEVIQNAFLSAMSATVLEEPLKELVKKFREDSKDGLSAEEVDRFKQAYNQIVQSGIDAMKDIEKVTGSIGGDKSSISSGRINRTISEDTASEILGFERARYDLAKQSFQQQQKSIADALRRYDSMVGYLQYLPAIEKNTGDAVTELQAAVVELKNISKNTGIKVGR